MFVVPIFIEEVRNTLHVHPVVKRGRIPNLSPEGRDLALEALDHVTDRHTRWYGMGVHYQVGSDALAGKGHVLLSVGDAYGTLLAMPTGELVPYLGYPDVTNSDLDENAAVLVDCFQYLDVSSH